MQECVNGQKVGHFVMNFVCFGSRISTEEVKMNIIGNHALQGTYSIAKEHETIYGK